jgi:hypothetical protein
MVQQSTGLHLHNQVKCKAYNLKKLDLLPQQALASFWPSGALEVQAHAVAWVTIPYREYITPQK